MTSPTLTILGIETTCDETAAAIVRRDADGAGTILSNVVRSQLDEHAPFGGVVPEIAARAHVATLDGLIAKALDEAGTDFPVLDGIAAAAGPGLIGGVIVGLTTAKAIALVHGKPLIAVNHLEGHAMTPGLTDALAPPYLLLLVSGGHTQLVHVGGISQYERLGTTVDDALGEAFDKVAKLLGLGFPGGPAVERMAATGDPARFGFPRPMKGRRDPHFSFSGLKTAVRHAVAQCAPLTDQVMADICASFQQAAVDTVTDRVMAAFVAAQARGLDVPALVISGGVAANARLREALADQAATLGIKTVAPPLALCTDNAAMIAWAGAERLALGLTDPLDMAPRARWPLDPDAAPVPGAGVKA